MIKQLTHILEVTLLAATVAATFVACSDDDSSPAGAAAGGSAGTSGAAGCPAAGKAGTAGCPASGAGGAAGCPAASLPPTSEAELLPWIDSGAYKSAPWKCEAKEKDGGQPHTFTRVCVNEAVQKGAPFGKDAATVKELYDKIGGTIIGHAVMRKTQAASDEGKGWYFYEKLSGQVVADGNGVALCVGCHSSSKTDFLFTVVK